METYTCAQSALCIDIHNNRILQAILLNLVDAFYCRVKAYDNPSYTIAAPCPTPTHMVANP